jgi:DNA-binding response OmpR family regulator
MEQRGVASHGLERRRKAMNAKGRILVVDDEKVVCDSCARIFGRRGFTVDTSIDPRNGLEMAGNKDYSAILLDVKMPDMDGLQFLGELRKANRDVPVIVITGYPSIKDVTAAMKLGACDYITKPFTPDEIAQTVTRFVMEDEPAAGAAASITEAATMAVPEVEPWVAAPEDYRFLDEAWLQLGEDGSVRVGFFLSRGEMMAIESARLPQLGDVVYRGLPLAVFTAGNKRRVIPSPVSGELIEVNQTLAGHPVSEWGYPCRECWIARLRPTDLEKDVAACNTRNVLVASADEGRAAQQRRELIDQGCKVRIARSLEEVEQGLRSEECNVVVLDAASFGEAGPEMAKKINDSLPEAKVVVIGGPGSSLEAAYRANKIFYYAVEPFEDQEIIDILEAAFRPAISPPPEGRASSSLSNWVSQIRITNRLRENVTLLASGETLLHHKGVGFLLIQSILDGAYPIQVRVGADKITPAKIMEEASDCDRLLILLAEDAGRIPGSLVWGAETDLVKAAGEAGQKATAFVVQPESLEGVPLVFDARTSRALAEHILERMTSNQEARGDRTE